MAALLTLELATASVAEGSSRLQQVAAMEAARSGPLDHVVVRRQGTPPYAQVTSCKVDDHDMVQICTDARAGTLLDLDQPCKRTSPCLTVSLRNMGQRYLKTDVLHGTVQQMMRVLLTAACHIHLLLLLSPTQLLLVDLRSHGQQATVSVLWSMPRTAYRGRIKQTLNVYTD
eukprot:1516382-Amphidinium_carterae.2